MELLNRLENFISKDPDVRLDSWEELFLIANDFLESKDYNKELAKNIAKKIFSHRVLMGASKAYEQATGIELQLLDISLLIARIGFGKTKPLIDFLKDALYYANYYPEKYDKESLEREIAEIEK